jgi:hypothetical protein
MSCPDNNPCNPCTEHQDCGCTNPNTFGCTTYSGTHLECLDVDNAEDGDSILAKIDAKVCDIGKVLISGDDTCPEYLIDKLEAGTNITLTEVGTGCDRTLRIDAVEGGVPIDINVRVSGADTTSGYLNNKLTTGAYISKTINNAAGNENLELDVVPVNLLSTDPDNPLYIGTDGGLMSTCIAPDGSETKVIQGTGVTVTGQGTIIDPYIVSTNPSIQVARPCFDAVWRTINLVPTGNANVIFLAGAPEYRYRFDGTLEFRGSISFTVNFAANTSANRKFTITMGNIPTTCLSLVEQAGTADLKSITYIESVGQMYNYIIRKSTQNLLLEFQSSFTSATSKVIVVNLDGAISHPNI